MNSTHRVTYDSVQGVNEDAFLVNTPEGPICFRASPLGLYYIGVANLNARSVNLFGSSFILTTEGQAAGLA